MRSPGWTFPPGPARPRFLPADLSRMDAALRRRFEGQDAVVHLAADRSPDAGWGTVVPQHRCRAEPIRGGAGGGGATRRLCQFQLGAGRLSFFAPGAGADTLPNPVNPYGMSKLMGERVGAHFAAAHGMTVVCVRIGWTNLDT